jgi:O-antigen/teichoic acid export membrane protein
MSSRRTGLVPATAVAAAAADTSIPAPRVRRNILANLVGSGWSAVMAIAFVPIYIRLMGVESYGLVGVYITVQAVLVLLDLGLSATASRELARLGPESIGTEGARLVRTLETVFWGSAAGIAVLAWILAPLASAWLRPEQLDSRSVLLAAGLMGLAVAAQWPTTLYTGSLMGLQRQVALNVVAVIVSTLRGAGAVLVLWLISPTIIAFFIWHVIVSVAQSLATRNLFWSRVGSSYQQRRSDLRMLRSYWRFAAGVAAIYALSLVVTQVDKIVLSRMLPLESFGYYALASFTAASLYRLVAPITGAVYPRLTQLWARGNQLDLIRLYHLGCQSVAAAVMPLMALLAFFPGEVLWVWTRNDQLVSATAPLLRILSVGVALNAAMTLPIALQLAHGRTRLVLLGNLAAATVMIPGLVLAVRAFGVFGAAALWSAINLAYLVVVGTLVHRSAMPGEAGRWFARDLLLPAAACLIVAAAFKSLVSGATSPIVLVAAFVGTVLLGLLASIAMAPALRSSVAAFLGPRGRGPRFGAGRATGLPEGPA